jgi:hypothetical protein
MRRKFLMTLDEIFARFGLPADHFEVAIDDGVYVTALVTPDVDGGRWAMVDVEPGPTPLDPPRWAVLAASSDVVEALAERSLRLHSAADAWSPAEQIPTLLLSLLADLNVYFPNGPARDRV